MHDHSRVHKNTYIIYKTCMNTLSPLTHRIIYPIFRMDMMSLNILCPAGSNVSVQVKKTWLKSWRAYKDASCHIYS